MDFEYITQNVAGPGFDSGLLAENFEGCQCATEEENGIGGGGGECCTATAQCACLLASGDNYERGSGKFLHGSDPMSTHLECHQVG